MGIEKDFSTKLSAGDVTIDRRDIEMLAAVDREGSMHGAAEELGRSYARLQNRIVELEAEVGQLTERQRGGRGGGGTRLTDTAHELRRRFDRYETELDGVATVTESVFTGTVDERTGELATVETAAGSVVALVPRTAREVQIGVRSDAVVLTDPDETPEPDGTSLRNRFDGTVTNVEAGEEIASVTLSLAEGVDLEALVTRSSRERLALEPGREVVASFKATAARGTRLESRRD
ncbi:MULTISPECIES: TOBE domain-containing protein [Natrialbaceae]|uniref:TOBE domain-containing protein n=1 Tax=Natrialbaceae TaxID=1644061 RepID=UPI00207C7BF1|nr:TOBE domain-containing protein [Natronococcus sp. CG52]